MTPKETPTPAVASKAAEPRAGRMSFQLVDNPPSARMSTRAAKPMACAAPRSLKSMPKPMGPSNIPTKRNSNRAGSPRRVPIRAAKAASNTTTAPMNRARSEGCTRSLFQQDDVRHGSGHHGERRLARSGHQKGPLKVVNSGGYCSGGGLLPKPTGAVSLSDYAPTR